MCFCYFCNATGRRVWLITLHARVRTDVDTIYNRGMMARRFGTVVRFRRNSELSRSGVNRTGQLSLVSGYTSFFLRYWSKSLGCLDKKEWVAMFRENRDTSFTCFNLRKVPSRSQAVILKCSNFSGSCALRFNACILLFLVYVIDTARQELQWDGKLVVSLKIVASDDSNAFYRLRCLGGTRFKSSQSKSRGKIYEQTRVNIMWVSSEFHLRFPWKPYS